MGSGPELLKLASRFNCSDVHVVGRSATSQAIPSRYELKTARLNCILGKVRADLDLLKPDPALSMNWPVLSQRAASAARCPAGGRDEFTLLPAAAATQNGSMKVYGSREDLITGGVKSDAMPHLHRGQVRVSETSTLDVVRWIRNSFDADDFVVLKMDIEGEEHKIVPALIEAGAAKLIDVFLWEFHYSAGHGKVGSMEAALEDAGVNVIYREPFVFRGAHRDRMLRKAYRAKRLIAAGSQRREWRLNRTFASNSSA